MWAQTVPRHGFQHRSGCHVRGGFSNVLAGSPRRPEHSQTRGVSCIIALLSIQPYGAKHGCACVCVIVEGSDAPHNPAATAGQAVTQRATRKAIWD